MKIAFDLDGVLRPEARQSEKYLQVPNKKFVDMCNDLFYKNHEIIIYTANPWQDYQITKAWLSQHNIRYSQLVCGKFPYDVLLDDRAYNVDDAERFLEKCNKK